MQSDSPTLCDVQVEGNTARSPGDSEARHCLGPRAALSLSDSDGTLKNCTKQKGHRAARRLRPLQRRQGPGEGSEEALTARGRPTPAAGMLGWLQGYALGMQGPP